VVVGQCTEKVEAALGERVETVRQTALRGTADAARRAAELLQGDARIVDVLIAHGDCPLLTGTLFRELIRCRRETGALIALVASPTDDPRGYGRVIRGADGRVKAIVEDVDATEEERAVRDINAGVYCVEARWLWEQLPAIQPSASGEYYLPDLVGLAVQAGQQVRAIESPMDVTAGVNDRAQLAMVTTIVQDRLRHDLMISGVTLIDPATTYLDRGVSVGQDTIIYPGTILEGATTVGAGCRIGPHSRIVDSTIGDGAVVDMSVVEGARVEDGARIGPFSHLRPGAWIESEVELGNFAEVKNSRIGARTKAHHVSYIGDARIGEDVNVGSGTITTNYDSESGTKSQTVVEDGASLGCDTMLVAPVTVGKKAMTGAGSVVTR